LSLLLRVEKWLESRIERFFGPRECVQPIEIARLMVRTMEDQRRISVQRTYVPNDFVIFVSQDDLVELQAFAHTLEQDLANHVKAAARRHNLAFPGPVSVDFKSDSDLNRGQARVQAQFVEGDEIEDLYAHREAETRFTEAPESTMMSMDKTRGYKSLVTDRPATWQVTVDEGPDAGAVFSIRLPATIGRRQDCDIQLHDPKVSRLHARLEMGAETPVIIDANSTNGTRLNGRLVRRASVGPDDRIEIGATRLKIAPAGGE
jgi:pSer/pThr/pTyr-binding forkhead associated (FHA) protein